ncbi:MAG: hypothetical protein Q8S43_02615 [Actinomycetota bacterium]|nr:MAG: hypothetical protein FD171_270 [Actinomycetota bacterium]MDO8949411.1 hypothetical protein [Actinomycetota bacterium]MDP3629834.1 hypothetical protein [Actinomycetota bacterium]
MGTATPDSLLGRRGRSAVGLALVASGAVGIGLLVVYVVGAPVDVLYMLALGVAIASVPGAVFIVPICGALLALIDRPWRRRVGWAGLAYGALVVVWVMSVIADVPWSKNVSDTFLLLGVYAALPLAVAVFALSIATGVALLRPKGESAGIEVRRLWSRSIIYGLLAVLGFALVVFGLMVLWAR